MSQREHETGDPIAGDFLENLVAAMRRHSAGVFEFENDDTFLSVVLEAESPDISPNTRPHTDDAPSEAELDIVVKSPELGLFTGAGKSIGDSVLRDDVIGFVCIGPLRLAIRAPTDGLITRELARDGTPIGYQEAVFSIRPVIAS
ncbi:hypothetical protein AA23498_0476 [Acetobacter nitrogenifigens DSM 23921 = NBRC 105050]|uniref:Lipoyl-binding domain-containing protein n=1 Tax=Acetobacter nitrogenifigens DSM 23921 = NBRC 105050 TaxID=1120919 RepID=A0A511XC98_9PROT|nr:hypothetical protein [Acetobacter nitrogenifigens]GBQ88838.1 hypothetical protein AA23498_0476 [Acetobacter nitrogenifigens DSM 23921 = NBRC 105050]GEN60505.1 hypothetical protein ANI02nite_23890 [Acetobacter nitrogenifigens DSM 23921 = NBRC 105050]